MSSAPRAASVSAFPLHSLAALATELRHALRSLARARRFTVLCISMLALGIGANVAIFSAFQSILLRPLPYPDPARLVGFSSFNSPTAVTHPSLSVADVRDLRARATSFDALAACRPEFVTYSPDSTDPAQLIGALVTEDFFRVLGTAPQLGRHFLPDEFALAAPRVAVLSSQAWRNRFGAAPDIVGRTVNFNHQPTTIVGVMPPSFREPEFVELWLPFSPEAPENLARDSRHWTTLARLKRDRSLASAHAELTTLAAALAQEYPGTHRGWTFAVQPLRELRTSGVQSALVLLVGAVGLVLLVACVNLANLMLARGVARLPEFAVRLSLGAMPGTLARTVFFESLLLALVGGALGVALVALGLPVLVAQLPIGLVPRTHEIRVDTAALLFAAVLSLVTGLAFGSLPAWQVLRTNVHALLKAGGSRGLAGGFARRAQSALIIAQVALTLIVLAGAGLLMRSLLALQRADLGFEPRHVRTLRVATNLAKWNDFTALARYYETLLTELRAVPGVESAALNCSTPLTGIALRFPYRVEGRPRTDGNTDDAVFNSVDPDYFNTLRLPLRDGRRFDARDHERAPAVCVINATLAQRLFPNESPLGKRLQVVPWLNRSYREVVGVVADVKQTSQADLPTPQLYVPSRQSAWFFTTLVVRAASSVTTSALQTAVRRADPSLSMAVGTLDDALARSTAQPRLRAALFALFGATALTLSAFGIYASMAFSVSQRVREIGLRLALGATPHAVLRWVLAHAARLSAWGVLAGLLGAAALAQFLRGTLYGVSPLDPLVLATLAAFLPLVALLSTLAPALRAARLDPARALQNE